MAIKHLLVVFFVTVVKALASQPSLPTDCYDIQSRGSNRTGNYVIYPDETFGGINVRCDLDTDGGGWTVFQRRVSDSDFYRSWDDYEFGFGDLCTNFWLGNRQISVLTSQGEYQLRIDMTHANGTSAYAGYRTFKVGDTDSKYKLTVKDYHGNAGDALTTHNGLRFSTKDRDYDGWVGNCAVSYIGAWWYGSCHSSNLNGDYGNTAYGKGLGWGPLTGFYSTLSAVEMKVKRIRFDHAGPASGTCSTLRTNP